MKTRVSKKLLWLCLSVIFTLALASAASAQPGEFVKGVLQPLADGFPKETITIINVDDPGTRDGIYARSLQEAARPMSPVAIAVTDEPVAAGGTWYKLKEVVSRKGGTDGYYPIIFYPFGGVTDLLVDPGTEEMGSKVDDLNMLVVTESFPYVWIQRKNAPWGKTFASMVKYAKENPGKLVYISREVGSGNDIACSMMMSSVGILDKVKKVPQGSMQECAAAVGAGQGDFAMVGVDVALTNWQSGRVDATLVTGDKIPAPWDKDPNVVTGDSAGFSKEVILSISLGLGVPKQVPQAHADWLSKLFKAAASSDVHQKRLKTIPGLNITLVSGKDANAQNKKIIELADPVVRAIGLHIEQQKKK